MTPRAWVFPFLVWGAVGLVAPAEAGPAPAQLTSPPDLLRIMEDKTSALKAQAEAARANLAKFPARAARGHAVGVDACCAQNARTMRDLVRSLGTRALQDLYKQAKHAQGIAIGERLNICMLDLTQSVEAFAVATNVQAAVTALESILTRLNTRTSRNIAEARRCCLVLGPAAR